MSVLQLALGTTLTLAGSAVYALIGARYLARRGSSTQLRGFALFWTGIAAYGALDGGWGLLVPLAAPPLAVGLVVLQLKILFGTAAFFGLVYHLLYVYTGRRTLLPPLALFYAFVYAVVVYSYAARDPIGQATGTWGSGLVYANGEGPVTKLAFALLFVPPLLASFAYAALLPRTTSREQRARVLATSGALMVFFAGLLLGWLTDAVPQWPLVEKCLAILLGLTLLRFVPREAARDAGRPAPAPSPAESPAWGEP